MLSTMFESMLLGGEPTLVTLTLYTDAFVIRGTLVSRQRRVTDMLNNAEDNFLVLGDVTSDEFGTRGETIRADYALTVGRNLVHASDGPDTARDELALWFAPEELVDHARDIDRWILE